MTFAVRPMGLAPTPQYWQWVGGNADVSSATVSLGVTAQAGDVIFALVTWNTAAPTSISGYTKPESASSGFYYRIATGGETSYSITGASGFLARALVIRPIGGVAQFESSTQASPATSTTSLPSVPRPGLLVSFANVGASVGSWNGGSAHRDLLSNALRFDAPAYLAYAGTYQPNESITGLRLQSSVSNRHTFALFSIT